MISKEEYNRLANDGFNIIPLIKYGNAKNRIFITINFSAIFNNMNFEYALFIKFINPTYFY